MCEERGRGVKLVDESSGDEDAGLEEKSTTVRQ